MIVLDDHYKAYYIHFDRVPYDPLKLVNLKKLEKKKKRERGKRIISKKKNTFFTNDSKETAFSVDVFIDWLEAYKDDIMCRKIVNLVTSCYFQL